MTENYSTPDTVSRFWSYARVGAPEECWFWTGAKRDGGYGMFYDGNRSVQAHRFALELRLGKPIGGGMVACHHCDNPPCVNPNHLFMGTRSDNSRDSMRKGRAFVPSHPRGVYLLEKCANGHLFTPDNTINRNDGRRCRTCKRASQSAWADNNRDKMNAATHRWRAREKGKR
jgi:hypothetical protein